jgi:hypothetical protein
MMEYAKKKKIGKHDTLLGRQDKKHERGLTSDLPG